MSGGPSVENQPAAQATVPVDAKPMESPTGAVSGVGEAAKAVEQRVVLYAWKAPQRYFKKLNRKTFMIIVGAVVLLSLLLVLLQEYFFIAALGSLTFLLFALGTYPPPLVTNMITNKGIEAAGEVFIWEVMKSFYYSWRDGQIMLNVETTLRAPGKIILLVDEKQKKEVYDVLSAKLMYKDMRKQARLSTYLDGEWIDMLQNRAVPAAK
jgi:hypothetical protein